MSGAGRRGGLRRPAGRIALLSLLRWKIAKVFGGFNRPLPQPKAGANGASAACPRAHLTALTHPRLTRLPTPLEQPGVAERKIELKRAATAAARPASQRVPAQEMVRPAAQLAGQFIRAGPPWPRR